MEVSKFKKTAPINKQYTYFISFTFNNEHGQAFANTVIKIEFIINRIEDIAFLNDVLKKSIRLPDAIIVILNIQLIKTEVTNSPTEN